MTEINTGERSGITGNHENEKKLTREQKKQAKIEASENRIKRRAIANIQGQGDQGIAREQRRDRDHILATSFTQSREKTFP